MVWLDEFAKLISDAGFEALASDGTKTLRKRNGVIAFATQSPNDVLASPISRTLIEQTPTKIFFPNADAHRHDYVDGFGLSDREFELIRTELTPGSRRFLIKQGRESVVAELDLKGFDGELKVISARSTSVAAHAAADRRHRAGPGGVVAQLSRREAPSRSIGGTVNKHSTLGLACLALCVEQPCERHHAGHRRCRHRPAHRADHGLG